MPTIQSADIWKESGRYDDYGKEMLRITDRHDREMLFGPTNEELITQIFANEVRTYRDLPKNLYHIQWKFRDEVRPRFGVMRGREFYMKDAYSFDLDADAGRVARPAARAQPGNGRHALRAPRSASHLPRRRGRSPRRDEARQRDPRRTGHRPVLLLQLLDPAVPRGLHAGVTHPRLAGRAWSGRAR